MPQLIVQPLSQYPQLFLLLYPYSLIKLRLSSTLPLIPHPIFVLNPAEVHVKYICATRDDFQWIEASRCNPTL